MKITLWMGILFGAAQVAFAATNDLSSTLQTGLFEEEANHDLQSAIRAYSSVAERFDKDRKLAATAIFRLGECYRKQGATHDAAAQYQRIVRDFSDQEPLVTLSRQSLAALGAPSAASAPSSGLGSATAEAEAASLKAQIERLKELSPEDRRVAVQQEFPNPVLTSLMQKLTEVQQNLATMRHDYGPGYHDVVNAEAQLATLTNQVDAQVRGVLNKLATQQAAAAARAKELASQSSPAPATSVEGDEVRRIQAMIKDSPDLINAKDSESGETPLHKAAAQGQLVVARFLLDNGADVGAGDRHDKTPLHDAAWSGHKAMVELLLQHGAQVQAADSEGKTPLHRAAERGFLNIAELLLAKGADANGTAGNGVTPLLLAVANGYVPVAELLLGHGADINAVATSFSSGRMTYHEAALHIAAHRADVPMTEFLLSKKAEVNLEGGSGRTALSYAATAKSMAVLTRLLATQADANAGRLDLPISLAAYNGDLPMLELLLSHGADAKARTSVDWSVSWYQTSSPQGGSYTPLFLAVGQGHAEAAQRLLHAGADPNEPSWSGGPFIFEALWEGNTNLLQVLLDGGAASNKHDSQGKTPLEVAVERNNASAVALLLAYHSDPNGVGQYGNTPLHTAASSGSDSTAQLLLKAGADVNARGWSGYTPLIYAVEQGHPTTAQLLLEYKADPNIRNNAGATPLDIAKSQPAPAQPLAYQWTFGGEAPQAGKAAPPPKSMVELLREHGAIENLPHLDRIELSRPAFNSTTTVFTRGTNDWNRFSLLELIAVRCGFLTAAPSGESRSRAFLEGGTASQLPFPDLAHIRIHRPGSNLTNWQVLTVDLSALADSGDCSKDVFLQWGDVVEIPEADHPLNQAWRGPSAMELTNFQKCLSRQVEVVVKGKARQLTLAPELTCSEFQRLCVYQHAPFWIKPALGTSDLVLASSELSRVKVKRRDPVTGQKREWIVDCSGSKPAPDLWLRDGDVIEVPDRS